MKRFRPLLLLATLVLVGGAAFLLTRPKRPDAHERAREFLRGYRPLAAKATPGVFAARGLVQTLFETDAPYRAEIARGERHFTRAENWIRSLPPNDPLFIGNDAPSYAPLLRRLGLRRFAPTSSVSLRLRPRKGGGCIVTVLSSRGPFDPR